MVEFYVSLAAVIVLSLFLAIIVWDIIRILNCSDSRILKFFSDYEKKIWHIISRNDVKDNLFDEFCKYLNEVRLDFGESLSIQDSITDIYNFIQRYKKFYVLAEKRSSDTLNLSRRFEKEKSMITNEITLIKNNISNFMLDRELYGFQLSSGKINKVNYDEMATRFFELKNESLERIMSKSVCSFSEFEKLEPGYTWTSGDGTTTIKVIEEVDPGYLAAKAARDASMACECICKDCRHPDICEDIRDDCPAEYHPAHGIECSFIDEETGEVIQPGRLDDDIDWSRGLVPPIRADQKKLPNGKLCHG